MRLATAGSTDIDAMRDLIFTHGSNDWNYLPPDGVAQELEDVRTGKAIAVLLEDNSTIVGFAVSYPSYIRFPNLVSHSDPSSVAYICDVVVNREYAGRGWGAQMLKRCQVELTSRGAKQIFIDCHEENLPSRGMMRKSGFIEVAVFDDPERRFVGSKRTSISLWSDVADV